MALRRAANALSGKAWRSGRNGSSFLRGPGNVAGRLAGTQPRTDCRARLRRLAVGWLLAACSMLVHGLLLWHLGAGGRQVKTPQALTITVLLPQAPLAGSMPAGVARELQPAQAVASAAIAASALSHGPQSVSRPDPFYTQARHPSTGATAQPGTEPESGRRAGTAVETMPGAGIGTSPGPAAGAAGDGAVAKLPTYPLLDHGLSAPAPLAVEQLGAEHYYKGSELSVRPQLRQDITPTLRLTVPGIVSRQLILRLLINAGGTIDRVEAQDSDLPAPALQAVTDAFGGLRFQPGQLAGTAVRSQLRIEVSLQAPAELPLIDLRGR